MNLRAVANSMTRAINPNIAGTIRVYAGEQKDASYNRTPTYNAAMPVELQIQALTKKEIEHLDALNLSDATRAAFANRQMTGVDRASKSGGDLLDFIDPETGIMSTWLVIATLQAWGTSGWCKVAISKQMDGVS